MPRRGRRRGGFRGGGRSHEPAATACAHRHSPVRIASVLQARLRRALLLTLGGPTRAALASLALVACVAARSGSAGGMLSSMEAAVPPAVKTTAGRVLDELPRPWTIRVSFATV